MEEKPKKSIFEIIVIILNIIAIIFMILIISELSITRTILYYLPILIIYTITLIIFYFTKKIILDCQDKIEKQRKIKKLNKIKLLTYLIISILTIIISLVYIESDSLEEYLIHEKSLNEITNQNFNSQFDIYEGIITGAHIKQLIKTVSTSNISNPVQQVTLILGNDNGTALWTETKNESDGTKTYKATNGIENSKKYDVSTSKGKDGMIETITITEKNR